MNSCFVYSNASVQWDKSNGYRAKNPLTGSAKGNAVLILRIDSEPPESELLSV